jgi:hypothetical protein
MDRALGSGVDEFLTLCLAERAAELQRAWSSLCGRSVGAARLTKLDSGQELFARANAKVRVPPMETSK